MISNGCLKPDDTFVYIGVADPINIEAVAQDGEPVVTVVNGGKIKTEFPGTIHSIKVTGGDIDLDLMLDVLPYLENIHGVNNESIYGDLSVIPNNLKSINVNDCQISGDIQFHDEVHTFRVGNGNTVRFDISDLPSDVKYICINEHNGVVNGSLEQLPTSMARFIASGAITGDYGNLGKSLPPVFSVSTTERMVYTKGTNYAGKNITIFDHVANGPGLTTKEVDDLLIDLSAANWSGTKRLKLGGNHDNRSARSNNAVITLKNKGVNVIVE